MLQFSLTLHIGHGKAGSTTLQAFLFRNWRALRAQGVELCTPDLGVTSETAPPGNILWPMEQMRESGDSRSILELIAAVRHARPDTRTLILSSETLSNPGGAALFAEVAKQVPLHVIYYMRRQDELLLAIWRQWALKRGLSLKELVARRLTSGQPDYAAILQAWQSIGSASIHARFLGKPFLAGGDLLADFCAAAGIEVDGLEPVSSQNVSPDARLLHFLSRHPTLFASPHDDTIIQTLAAAMTDEPNLRACLTPWQAVQIRDRFEAGNQAVLKDFHLSCHGTPVIDPASAPTGPDIPAPAAQRAYVMKAVERLSADEDNGLAQLRCILTDEKCPE